MREHFEFFRQFRGRSKSIGAIVPSSRFLAGAITEPYRRRKRPARILEVGPGTGAVTRKIVERLTPDDRFDLVELNESFAALLQRRFRVDPVFRRVAAHSNVHVCP
ncbi:MAG: rRNA adenine N-6-methyltransferase family protein, partial [Planctomycetaceae bacterium]